jgi:tetratricopeptide (TPR) repeat protein
MFKNKFYIFVFYKVLSGLLFLLFLWNISGCSPYSLPEKKTYSEKDDPYIYYAESIEAYEVHDYQLALENIDLALLLNDNLAQFFQLKGDIHRALSENDAAIQAYESAIKRRSNYIEVHESLADLYEKLKQYDEAIRYYKRAVGLEPERLDILLKIVNCYIQWNEMEVANHYLDSYEKNAAGQKKSLSDRYHVLRGEVLFLMNKYELSLDFLSNVSQPDSLTLYLYGKNYYALNDYSKGVSYFNKLLNEDKNNGSWYFYRGIYFYNQKNFIDAKGQFEYTLDLDNTLYEAHYYLGKIYVEEGDQSSALKEFEIYLRHEVDSDRAEEVNKTIQSLQSPTE